MPVVISKMGCTRFWAAAFLHLYSCLLVNITTYRTYLRPIRWIYLSHLASVGRHYDTKVVGFKPKGDTAVMWCQPTCTTGIGQILRSTISAGNRNKNIYFQARFTSGFWYHARNPCVSKSQTVTPLLPALTKTAYARAKMNLLKL